MQQQHISTVLQTCRRRKEPPGTCCSSAPDLALSFLEEKWGAGGPSRARLRHCRPKIPRRTVHLAHSHGTSMGRGERDRWEALLAYVAGCPMPQPFDVEWIGAVSVENLVAGD